MQNPVANIKSQIKRIGTNEKARLRNKAAKAEVKTRVKTAITAAETGHEEAPEYLRMAVKRLDKAASRGIIHRNQAANRKSALMRHVARVGAEASSAELEQEPEAVTAAEEAPTTRSRRRR
jgi:small subunit ribosomal protein S20